MPAMLIRCITVPRVLYTVSCVLMLPPLSPLLTVLTLRPSPSPLMPSAVFTESSPLSSDEAFAHLFSADSEASAHSSSVLSDFLAEPSLVLNNNPAQSSLYLNNLSVESSPALNTPAQSSSELNNFSAELSLALINTAQPSFELNNLFVESSLALNNTPAQPSSVLRDLSAESPLALSNSSADVTPELSDAELPSVVSDSPTGFSRVRNDEYSFSISPVQFVSVSSECSTVSSRPEDDLAISSRLKDVPSTSSTQALTHQPESSMASDPDVQVVAISMPVDVLEEDDIMNKRDEAEEESPDTDISSCGTGAEYSCKDRCGLFRETPCSCHAQCLLYGTCCEDIAEQCPETDGELTAAERSYLKAGITCPEYLHWPVVARCPPHDVPSHLMDSCYRQFPLTASDVIPVTDTISGVHFKNVYCARCNGVSLTHARPWSGQYRCDTDLQDIHDLWAKIINGSRSGEQCGIDWESPYAGTSHARCLPESRVESRNDSCQNETLKRLCRLQHASYLSVRGESGQLAVYKNRYCLLCDAEHFQGAESCQTLQREELDWSAQYKYSMQVVWNQLNKTWTFRSQASNKDNTHAMSLDTVICQASPDLAPEHCHVLTCHPSFTLINNSCQPVNPFPHTVFFLLQILPHQVHDYHVNTTHMLEVLESQLQNLKSDGELVSVQTAGTTQDDQYLSILFKLFTNFTDERSGLNLVNEFLISALTVFEDRGITFARFCFKIAKYHVSFEVNCTEFSVYGLRYVRKTYNDDGGFSISQSRNTMYMGDVGLQESWTWRNYLSIACIALSILSLSFRVILQAFVAFFHSYASRLQFFLCLSLLLGYVAFMCGGFPAPGSIGCVMSAVATHWAMLSALLWMNVNAVQIWRIFRPGNWSRVSPQKKIHYSCHLYAWLAPLLLVGPEMALDRLLPDSILAPMYGKGQCWFNRGYALLVSFVIPSIFLSLLNFVFLVLITHAIHTQKMRYNESTSSVALEVRASSKLVVLVGVTWLLGIPVAVHDEPILGDIFTLANANLGFFITLAIMANRFFYKSVKDQWERRRTMVSTQTKLSRLSGSKVSDGHIVPPHTSTSAQQP